LPLVKDIVGPSFGSRKRAIPLDDEDGAGVDLVSLLDWVEGALKELLKLQEELSGIMERQVERRVLLIETERMTGIQHWLTSLSDQDEQ
jgi:hypothetical protein